MPIISIGDISNRQAASGCVFYSVANFGNKILILPGRENKGAGIADK
jgi:hypothetical protein